MATYTRYTSQGTTSNDNFNISSESAWVSCLSHQIYGLAGYDTFSLVDSGNEIGSLTVSVASNGIVSVGGASAKTYLNGFEEVVYNGLTKWALNKATTANDSFKGSTGNDTIDGLTGTDTVSYATGATKAVTVNLSKTTAQITGGSGSDTLKNIENLIGSKYGDTLTGNTGANIITGGLGNDTLTGGSGKDIFKFDGKTGSINIDKITDFKVVDDTIQLSKAIFTVFGATAGEINSTKFVKNTTGLAQDSNDYLIYETDTGKLFYDANGNASGGQVQIALLGKSLALTSADFVLI